MRKVAFLLFDGVNALDVSGPLEAFAGVPGGYQPVFFSLDGETVRTESGLKLVADGPAQGARGDLLIVPGGAALRAPERLERAAKWLRRSCARYERVASVCTGAYALAHAGLLDGRRATTHWRHARDLALRYPDVRVEPDALYLRDGKFYSSGGVAAGIDLALALIEEDHGARTATAAAREMVVYLRRTGAQAQFSEPLKLQSVSSDRLSEACAWAANNLSADISVEAMAQRAHLSPRQFSRLFKQAFGASPGQYITRVRLDGARAALAQPGATIERVAHSAGFESADGFRRAFEKQFQVSPREYQRRFAGVKP